MTKKIFSLLSGIFLIGTVMFVTLTAYATTYDAARQNCTINNWFPLSVVTREGSGWRCSRRMQILPFVVVEIANYYIA